jgi:rhamnose transport system ATP-binding protein
MALLQLTGISKSFGAVRALRGVTFDLQPGELHALLGENGAGKSTLIKVITGAHQPDTGAIELDGVKCSRLTPQTARRHGLACIYQQPALFPDLTVAENIALRLEPPSAFRKIRWGERRERARKLLEQIGSDLSPDAEASALSIAEQQLVEIACAVGAKARILIMDEPTASLTPREQKLLYRTVEQMRELGVGIIYISHRLEEVFQLADRVTVLRDGESVGTSRLDEISEPELIRRMVGREVNSAYPPAAANPGKPILVLENVGCASSGVHSVNLTVRCGEVLGIAGLIGAGRTELARILFGITPATSGRVIYRGESIAIGSPREAVKHGIAYAPEDRRRHGIVLELPISQNTTVAVQSKLFRNGWLRSAAERSLTINYIQRLGIKTTGPEAAGATLSGGNQQKVVLARWLATNPQLLILDEPTQGIDVGAKGEIHQLIRQLTNEGLAVMMISSDLPEVLGMSDRIAVMRGGTVVAEFPRGVDGAVVMSAAMGIPLNK